MAQISEHKRFHSVLAKVAVGTFLLAILLWSKSKQVASELRGEEKESRNEPRKIGFCPEDQWPRESIMVDDGVTAILLFLEAEGVTGYNASDRGEIEVLVAVAIHGINYHEDQDEAEAVKPIFPQLECHFREEPIGSNARRWPIYRSSAKIEMLAESVHLGHVAAKIKCDLPSKGLRTRSQKMYWQLALASNSGNSAWISAPSLPLCVIPEKDKVWPVTSFFPISVDDYRPRGIHAKAEIDTSISIALCVAPSAGSDMWSHSSIRDWLNYQRRIVGFSQVFYLDAYGDELRHSYPATSLSHLGLDLLHLPHTSFYQSLSVALRGEGAVAVSLTRERCAMLARQRGIEYVHYSQDPMDLIVPMQRRNNLLSKAVSAAVGDGCAERLHLSKAVFSFSKVQDDCLDGEWCLPDDKSDAISRILMNGNPSLIEDPKTWDQKPSSAVLWRVARNTSISGSTCNVSASISTEDILFIARRNRECENDTFVNETTHFELKWKLSDVGIWTRIILKAFSDATVSRLSKANPRSIKPVASLPSDHLTSIWMCNSLENDPVYGKATLLRKLDECQERNDIVETVLQLTFYSAEVVRNGHNKLKISVLAEDKESREFSFQNDSAWGRLHQSLNPPQMLPNIDCVFFPTDPSIHVVQGEIRTPGKWIQHSDIALWLECLLPSTLEFPSSVSIEVPIGTEHEYSLHMIRSISICDGRFLPRRLTCDSSSLACRVGCIDEGKLISDSLAKCCSRCHDKYDRYTRNDDRDFWIPSSSESQSSSKKGNSTTDLVRQYLNGKDLSICLRPFFLETVCAECDGQKAISPQRLIEWIEYHILIGFDKIYILDRYGGSLMPLVQSYIRSGRVIHLPFPFLSDTPLSSEARSDQSKIVPAGHDQILAYDYCLSQGRLRNDAFVAFIDSDEFIRYPRPQAGMLRSAIISLFSDTWDSNDLPDSISLDRFDVQVVSPKDLHLGTPSDRCTGESTKTASNATEKS